MIPQSVEKGHTSDSDDDIVIGDVENYYSTSDKQYSHQVLVMKCMHKCIDAGCREMRAGWFNEKIDRNGNLTRTIVDDTRKAFISSVQMLNTIIQCDMDDIAKENIKKLKEKLNKKFKELVEEEKKDWEKAPHQLKQQRWNNGVYYVEGYLNNEMRYYQEFIEEQVEIYREILGELDELTKRLDFYKGEDFVA